MYLLKNKGNTHVMADPADCVFDPDTGAIIARHGCPHPDGSGQIVNLRGPDSPGTPVMRGPGVPHAGIAADGSEVPAPAFAGKLDSRFADGGLIPTFGPAPATAVPVRATEPRELKIYKDDVFSHPVNLAKIDPSKFELLGETDTATGGFPAWESGEPMPREWAPTGSPEVPNALHEFPAAKPGSPEAHAAGNPSPAGGPNPEPPTPHKTETTKTTQPKHK